MAAAHGGGRVISPGSPESAGGTPLSPRARLYDRLPVTADVAWWQQLARASCDGRVLELGCGTGRLTLPLAEVAEVIAVDHDPTAIARLDERGAALAAGRIRGIVADVTTLALGERVGLVLLPVSLLNELTGEGDRDRVLQVAAAHCLPAGRVALQLLNPLWLLGGGRSRGVVEGVDGTRVRLQAQHEVGDVWTQRARAELRYRFADGTVLVDELDAVAVFPRELELALAQVGLAVVETWGSEPGAGPPRHDDGAWHVVAAPVTG